MTAFLQRSLTDIDQLLRTALGIDRRKAFRASGAGQTLRAREFGDRRKAARTDRLRAHSETSLPLLGLPPTV